MTTTDMSLLDVSNIKVLINNQRAVVKDLHDRIEHSRKLPYGYPPSEVQSWLNTLTMETAKLAILLASESIK